MGKRRLGLFLPESFMVNLRLLLLLLLLGCDAVSGVEVTPPERNAYAYATMMYMGTPRDYEYYIATRVMLRSLRKLQVAADLVVIASIDVPRRWIRALEEEDGAKVTRVENLNNPYSVQSNFDIRFKLTLNKLYVWRLVQYERVVMLDADNLFLRGVDELFGCGQFCTVFINPCIFHTGLFVLEPSMAVFNDMVHELEVGRSNPDGADQGFIGGYFPDLLDRPMFHPSTNGTKLNGTFRLPFGYQMDASYYYLKLRWNVPCGPNSVITFPGAPWLKPWYWWSWPVLPLGLQWHEKRLQNLGYSGEMSIIWLEAVFYITLLLVSHLSRCDFTRLWRRRDEKSTMFFQIGFKLLSIWSILVAYMLPFFLIPRTIHPLIGWSLYLLGALSLCTNAANALQLSLHLILVPWLEILGCLLVMAFPWYSDGVVRALFVFVYGCSCTPLLWRTSVRIVYPPHISSKNRLPCSD